VPLADDLPELVAEVRDLPAAVWELALPVLAGAARGLRDAVEGEEGVDRDGAHVSPKLRCL
jgi:hypothetical protein